MAKRSAGLLMYRKRDGVLEVFLVHPGGPFWARKDLGTWSIPKGEFDESEDGLAAAKREFLEEVGQKIEGRAFLALTPARQKGGKVVYAWAVQGEVDEAAVTSNEFEMEWPPKSGRTGRFPEVDRGQWFSVAEARRKLVSGQVPIVDELARNLGVGAS